MNILVINCGSSSIKFQLIRMQGRTVLAKGLLERIGLDGSRLKYQHGNEKIVVESPVADHEEGINLIVSYLTHKDLGVIRKKSDIFAIGHRVVHAGERFSGTVMISDEVVDTLRECIPLAPLHNPPNIIGIEATRKILPGIPMAGVFDTAFHQTMPAKAYLYPIPNKYYDKYRIRRYGFHGTSHYFVCKEGAKQLNRKMEELKIISCHLGNGSSIAAVDRGSSVDTSMGFTPLEGLMMGTRCGDIDPAIPLFLQRKENLSIEEIENILNRQSGVKGLSEISSDMRDIENRVLEGDVSAIQVQEIFSYKIRKYIGAYTAVMNGVDLVIFTGGIGENDFGVRERVLQHLEFLGIDFDRAENRQLMGRFGQLSTADSRVKVLVIPTNEELEIAEQTLNVIQQNRANN